MKLYICFAQTQINETQKMSSLCKVWGFLKYYHPRVANGKYDWDKELMKKILLVKSARTKDNINDIYIDWLNSLGEIKKCKHCDNNLSDTSKFYQNMDFGWLNDSSIFTNELISKLNFIKENRSRKAYYIQSNFLTSFLSGEKVYRDSIFPNEGLRIVSLFRYWNIINYLYPYKYVIGENWNDVLTEMIPLFQNPKDTLDYHLAMLELTTKINDSHSWFLSSYTRNFFGNYEPSFDLKIIDHKVIVYGSYYDSLSKKDDIQNGDVILKVNGKNILEIIDARSKYVGASNEPTKLRRLSHLILCNNTDSILIEYERNSIVKSKSIKLYDLNNTKYKEDYKKESICKELRDNIGYVNMGQIRRKQVDSVMKIMMNKKAIIFDIRNYPNGTAFLISWYLNKDILPFVRFTSQDIAYPGVFKWSPLYYTGKKKMWFAINNKGRKNTNYFKGKVILLINETTQSQAEFTCMVLKTAPNVTCVGSQTAGADGDVKTITFPGNYQTWMTGLGVFYPDGKETERIGIIPDIEINPTIQGIKNKKDEVLERAIEYINTGK